MSDPVTITIESLELDSRLAKLARNLADVRPMLEEIGIVGSREVKENFKAGGRPEKWPVSGRARKQSGQTLMDTGNLRGSVNYDVQGREVAIGSNVMYGPIHHFGGKIFAKNAKYLRFKGPDGWVMRTSVNIPARPWLVLHKQTYGRFNAIIRDHVEGKNV